MSTTLYTDIRAALTQRLGSLPQLPQVAWENTTFIPTVGKAYLAPCIIWSETNQAEIGAAGRNWEGGIYQIDAIYPPNEGPGPLNKIMGALKDHFKRGTSLLYNGLEVKIKKVYPGPQSITTAGIRQPITIVFQCQAPN